MKGKYTGTITEMFLMTALDVIAYPSDSPAPYIQMLKSEGYFLDDTPSINDLHL